MALPPHNRSIVAQAPLGAIVEALGARILPDKGSWINRIEIKSETTSRLYIIAQRRGTGELGCSCLGWIASGRGGNKRTCKHVRRFLGALSQIRRIK